jgi:dTMP kinase
MKYHVAFDLDFKRNPYKGSYIAIEGVDGSGKTAQVDHLVEYFEKKGKKVVRVREPRKTEGILAPMIQDLLLGKIEMSPVAMQYIFTADRILNQIENVIPALKAGKILISDRSFWSIVPNALPDIGLNFTKKSIDYMLTAQGLLSMYHQTIVPERIFFLDVSVNTSVKRLSKKTEVENEIYEKREKIENHYRGYHWLLKHFSKEFTVIDGEQSEEKVTDDLLKSLRKIV